MYETMTEGVAMAADKSLCLWTSPFPSALKRDWYVGVAQNVLYETGRTFRLAFVLLGFF